MLNLVIQSEFDAAPVALTKPRPVFISVRSPLFEGPNRTNDVILFHDFKILPLHPNGEGLGAAFFCTLAHQAIKAPLQ